MDVGKTIRCGIAAATWCVLSGSMAAMADGDYHRAVDKALADLKAAGHSRPIVETHIHFWQVTRQAAYRGRRRRKDPFIATFYQPITRPWRKRTASSPQASSRRAESSKTTNGSSIW
jgi:hypothetical protein